MTMQSSPPEMLGEAPAFLDALARASVTAPLERPVLIIGERGTGKELFAARLHFLSRRWENPFIKVNCAALSEELLESELFGHEAGAFTGATKRHAGRFERADGGTLFLDEIASASLRIQEKLLRVIEYGEYERLGGDTTRIANARIVAAANVDLRLQCEQGKFRADLLDRLAFEVIAAPPLRKRQEDIALLASHFASRFASELNRDPIDPQPATRADTQRPLIQFPGFSASAIATLRNYEWPGNVRELKNVAERSFYRWSTNRHTDEPEETSDAYQPQPIDNIIIDPFELENSGQANIGLTKPSAPPEIENEPQELPPQGYDLRAHLRQTEFELVYNALEKHQWQQKHTAQYLGITYHQMRGLIRKHRLIENKTTTHSE